MSGKISFSFSKTKPKTGFQTKRQQPQENIEYITSFDKNKNEMKKNDNPPDVIIQVKPNLSLKERIYSKQKEKTESATEITSENKTEKTMVDDGVSLEKLAIQELIEDSKKANKDVLISIPVNTVMKFEDESVDYDSVPVSQFGYAMLRGMGWAPGKGVGKKQKVVEVKEPNSRTGGMGLGLGAPISITEGSSPMNKYENGVE